MQGPLGVAVMTFVVVAFVVAVPCFPPLPEQATTICDHLRTHPSAYAP
jgi:hypothetical protein